MKYQKYIKESLLFIPRVLCGYYDKKQIILRKEIKKLKEIKEKQDLELKIKKEQENILKSLTIY